MIAACYMVLCIPTKEPIYGPICQSDIRCDSRTRYPTEMGGRPSLIYTAAYQKAYWGSSGRPYPETDLGIRPFLAPDRSHPRSPYETPNEIPYKAPYKQTELDYARGSVHDSVCNLNLRTAPYDKRSWAPYGSPYLTPYVPCMYPARDLRSAPPPHIGVGIARQQNNKQEPPPGRFPLPLLTPRQGKRPVC